MKRTSRKFLAMLLAALMVFQTFPLTAISALAEGEPTYSAPTTPEGFAEVDFVDHDDTSLLNAKQLVAEGSTPIVPEDPTREEYKFTGWDPAVAAVPQGARSVIYKAQYDPIPKYTLTVKYMNGLESVATDEVREYASDETISDTITSPAVEGGLFADHTSLSVTNAWLKAQDAADGTVDYTIVFTVNYTTSNASYTVRHYFENANDDGYTHNQSLDQTVGGIVGVEVVAASLTDVPDGFTYDETASTRATLEASGTVVNAYYKRNINFIIYNPVGGAAADGVATTVQGKYGSTVTLPSDSAFSKQGYSLDGWSYQENGAVIGSSTIEMPLEENTVLFAKWQGNPMDYSIVYWLERPNVSGSPDPTTEGGLANYAYYTSDVGHSTTGSTVTLTASDVTAPFVTSGNTRVTIAEFKYSDTAVIAGDGTTVLNVYFNRKLFTYTFSGFDGNSMTIGGEVYGRVLTCGKEEHTHSWWNGCYFGSNLTCTKEEHTHNNSCYSTGAGDYVKQWKYGQSLVSEWPTCVCQVKK